MMPILGKVRLKWVTGAPHDWIFEVIQIFKSREGCFRGPLMFKRDYTDCNGE